MNDFDRYYLIDLARAAMECKHLMESGITESAKNYYKGKMDAFMQALNWFKSERFLDDDLLDELNNILGDKIC
jgi:hypothetical protein